MLGGGFTKPVIAGMVLQKMHVGSLLDIRACTM